MCSNSCNVLKLTCFVDEIKYNHSYKLSFKWNAVVKEYFSYFRNRVPDFVREKRFGNWLKDARDWAISRNRYWGTPIPLWVSDDFEEVSKRGFQLTENPVCIYHLLILIDRYIFGCCSLKF